MSHRNIEAMLAVSEVRSGNLVNVCTGVSDRIEHLDKCSRVIRSRLEAFRRVIGGENSAR